jgi:hypothetical protein
MWQQMLSKALRVLCAEMRGNALETEVPLQQRCHVPHCTVHTTIQLIHDQAHDAAAGWIVPEMCWAAR